MTPRIFYIVELLLYDTESRFSRFRIRVSLVIRNKLEKRSKLARESFNEFIFKIYKKCLIDLSLKKQSLLRTLGMNCSYNLMTVRGTRNFNASYATPKNLKNPFC
jgi:hypothetical protein